MSEAIDKVLTTSTVASGGGGLLNAEQTNQFLDYMWDTTVLGQQVRKIQMRANEIEIDKVAIGERIVRGAVEAVDTGENAGAIFTKISLSTKKLRLDWEVSTETLEDSIEGERFDDHLAQMMAQQFGADVEDLAINGDTTSTDPLLKQFDGYSKLLKAGGHVVDAEGKSLSRGVLNEAIKAMPRKYRQQRGALKFFAGSGVIQDYIYSLQAVETGMVNPETLAAAGISQAVAPNGNAGFRMGNAFGYGIQEIPLFNEERSGTYTGATGTDHSEIWLTSPQNLLWGVKRDVVIYNNFAQKKDSREYTAYMRVGVQVQHADAAVVVTNIKAAGSTL